MNEAAETEPRGGAPASQEADGEGTPPTSRLPKGLRQPGPDDARPPAGQPTRPLLRWIGYAGAAVAAVAVPFFLGRTFGPVLRGAAMVTTETSPAASAVSFDDASRMAAAFMASRDTATVIVPWAMTAREVLRLYHLENNLSARAALLEKLGVADLETVLAEGSSFSFVLSPEHVER